MKVKSKTLRQIAPMVQEEYSVQAEQIMADAAEEMERLCAQHPDESKAVRQHTRENLYPCISLYRALQKNGVPAQEAQAFLDRSWSRRAEKQAASMRSLMKIPGLYRLYPAMFRSVAKQMFGVKAGFAARFYPTEKSRTKFDMTRCLFCDVCEQQGCPELTVCFCHTDDVNNGTLHPRLCWNRSKIMGDGGDCCDFDIFVTDKK